MKVLMFGWEFPPHISGGLGTACYGLTKGLSKKGVDITFVIPRLGKKPERSHVRLIDYTDVLQAYPAKETAIWATRLKVMAVESLLEPYVTEETYLEMVKKISRTGEKSDVFDLSNDYGPNIFESVSRYARIAGLIARQESFDVIHVHDWMTIPAGMEAKYISGKPLVVHIHALEFDRSGIHVNQRIYDIERAGMENADQVITVSHYTKKRIMEYYDIPEGKISVVHNAVSRMESIERYHVKKTPSRKYVLFLGRITFQKGPDYFIEAAKLVLDRTRNTHFIMAGSGDMMPRLIERVSELRMGTNFHFVGFLKGQDVERAFAMSDVYVMPSISEPFGISALEGAIYDVPVIISRQSGVAEVLNHALKVDFWDVRELANKILGVLSYGGIHDEITTNAKKDLRNISWEMAGSKILDVYNNLM
ncbi:MAG: glycosyltransferase family 4 protein [Deltaproteobacteria bacterium]|nr:glycosyltransferase family 4 protein [Deltaproteobacteria bacterium]